MPGMLYTVLTCNGYLRPLIHRGAVGTMKFALACNKDHRAAICTGIAAILVTDAYEPSVNIGIDGKTTQEKEVLCHHRHNKSNHRKNICCCGCCVPATRSSANYTTSMLATRWRR